MVRDASTFTHLPPRFPYPRIGDLRWRPLEETSAVLPWIELIDGRTMESQGLAAGVARLGSGKIVYLWFRLTDIPFFEGLLYDVWMSVLRR